MLLSGFAADERATTKKKDDATHTTMASMAALSQTQQHMLLSGFAADERATNKNRTTQPTLR